MYCTYVSLLCGCVTASAEKKNNTNTNTTQSSELVIIAFFFNLPKGVTPWLVAWKSPESTDFCCFIEVVPAEGLLIISRFSPLRSRGSSERRLPTATCLRDGSGDPRQAQTRILIGSGLVWRTRPLSTGVTESIIDLHRDQLERPASQQATPPDRLRAF